MMTIAVMGRDEMTKVYEVELNSQSAPNFATAEEITCCEKCKKWYPFPDRLFGYCRLDCWANNGMYRETAHDDYCSYGERRDG